MPCPTLSELPPPPPSKTGWPFDLAHDWPWTEESSHLPDAMPNGSPWPRVSIVTPSYGQGQFIEETIRSVLLQGYPNLEYIIIDGGSTDGSVDIIRKYERWLAYWVSEPDRGQSDAINKGWAMATGEIVAYLNSDDTYCPRAIRMAVEFMTQHLEAGMIYGDCDHIDGDGRVLLKARLPDFNIPAFLCRRFTIWQPAVFLRRKAIGSVGMLDPNLDYCMDYELWLRVMQRFPIVHVPQFLANARFHASAKSVAQKTQSAFEAISVFERFFSQNIPDETLSLRNPVLSRAYLWKAYTYYTLGQMAEARRWAIIAFKLNPSFTSARKVLRLLMRTLLTNRLSRDQASS